VSQSKSAAAAEYCNSFVRNQWYVAAWAKDVGNTPLSRLICEEPIVLYRRSDGHPAALEDTCPHRLLPLSMGFVEGDAIRCLYHGLLLGPNGGCLEMPGNDAPNRAVCVRAYPVVERYQFVWVWIGEPEKADPALLPNLWMTEADGWRVGGGTYNVACDYRLLIDNLMDLTHETYVHASSIGQKELHDFPITTEVHADKVVTSRWMPSVTPPPLYSAALGGYDGLVDRWQIIEFLPPAGVVIDVGVAKLERKATLTDHSSADVRSFVLDFATPATERTCTYFWGSARTMNIDDDDAFDRFTAKQGDVFLEDVAVLEAQQRRIDQLPDRSLRAFSVDSGGVRARLMLQRMLREGQRSAEAE
jgi:phenylpropionate dioxygenase-like ring-hydroxylating dioxygenase large terminal subunit